MRALSESQRPRFTVAVWGNSPHNESVNSPLCTKGRLAMFTTAEDWFDRFKAAGGRMRIDAASMYLLSEKEMSATVEAIWNEFRALKIQRSGNWSMLTST